MNKHARGMIRMKQEMIKQAFHLVGLSCSVSAVGLVFMTFIAIALEGRVGYVEPNSLILGAEIGVFGFTLLYSGYNLKKWVNGVVANTVWEKQKRCFYE